MKPIKRFYGISFFFQNLSSCRDIRRNLQTFLIGRKIDPKNEPAFSFPRPGRSDLKKKRRNEKTKSKGNYTFFKSCIPTEPLQPSLIPSPPRAMNSALPTHSPWHCSSASAPRGTSAPSLRISLGAQLMNRVLQTTISSWLQCDLISD